MDAQDPRWAEIAQLQEKLIRSLEELSRVTPGSLELVKPPVPQRSPGMAAQDDASTAPSTRYHQGHFDARHNLSREQAWLAEQILKQKKPFRGPHAQQREAARIAGIVSSVKNGRIQNSCWGRKMLARRGGLAMAAHGLHLLREQAPRGGRAAAAARERKKALTVYEQTGQVLPLKTATGQNAPALDRWTLEKSQRLPFMLW